MPMNRAAKRAQLLRRLVEQERVFRKYIPKINATGALVFYIVAQTGDGVRVSDIAKQAGLKINTASSAIAALCKPTKGHKEGIVCAYRDDDRGDHRARYVSLTRRGHALVDELLTIFLEK